MLADINAAYMCGFKTSECNIEDLSQANISKFFTVPKDEGDKDEYCET